MALTKFNYNSFDVTPVASKALAFNSDADGLTTAAEGSMVLIKTVTASDGDASISFVDGTDDVVLDNTYPTYLFKCINMHPETNSVTFGFQGNAAGGSGYNETMTTTWFQAYHNESGTDNTSLNYQASEDQAQGTAFQGLCESLGSDNDQNYCGELWLFNPSSTTFVKHFMVKGSETYQSDFANSARVAGYFNTTSAIDEIQFKMSSGDLDAGSIKLYGIKDS